MKYNFYTKSSPKVSEIGFGAWQLGNSTDWSKMNDNEAVGLVHKALDEGINFFDTAPNYAGGNSEKLLGKAFIGKDRTKLVISTKFGHWPNSNTDFNANLIRKSVEDSLLRLRTDYIDSILLHNPEHGILIGEGEHYEILEELIIEGKILAYGASLDRSDEINDFINNTKGELIEAFFNIFHQDSRYAFSHAIENKIGIIAKIPLDSGWLSGKYNSESVFKGIRERWSREDIIRRSDLVDRLRDMPVDGQNLAQYAIGYCLSYDAVATVIPGCINESQLLMNIKSSDFRLSEVDKRKLENFYDEVIRPMNLPW